MRLLIIISSFPTGEHTAGLFLPDLIDALIARGCAVHVLTQNCEWNSTEHRVVKPGYELTLFGWRGGFVPLVSLLRHGPRGWWLAWQYLRNAISEGTRVAREWKADALLAEWLIPAGAVAREVGKKARLPYAARALGSDVMVAGKNPLLRGVLRKVARDASALFADGYDLCERTSELADGKPCAFTPTVRALGSERSGFQLAEEKAQLTLCCVGRLHRTKGQDVLIDAVALCKQRGLRVEVYLVGVGEEAEQLKQQVVRLGLSEEVHLTGRLPDGDIRAMLDHCDAAVIPSRSESIPLVLREAVDAGRPVIATEVGDMGMLVGKYALGHVVRPDDAGDLADALGAMIAAPHQFNSVLRNEFLAIFSVEQAADTILTTLQNVVARRAGGPS